MTFFSQPDGSAGERRIFPRSRKARVEAEAPTPTVADEEVVVTAGSGVSGQSEEWTPAPRRLEVPPATTGLYNPFAEISAMVPANPNGNEPAWTRDSAARVVTLPGEQPDFYSAKVEIAPVSRSGQPVTMSRDSSFHDSDGRGGGGFGRSSRSESDTADTASRSRITSRTRRDSDTDANIPTASPAATSRIERTILPRTRRGRDTHRSTEQNRGNRQERFSDSDLSGTPDPFGDRLSDATETGSRSSSGSRGRDTDRDSLRNDNAPATARWRRFTEEDDSSTVDEVQPDSERRNRSGGLGRGWVRFFDKPEQPTEPPSRSTDTVSEPPAAPEDVKTRATDDADYRYREDKYLDLGQIAPAPKDTRNDDAPSTVPSSREVPSVPVVPETRVHSAAMPERPAAITPDTGLKSPTPLNAGGDWQPVPAPVPERSEIVTRGSENGADTDYASFRSVTDDKRVAYEPEPPPVPPALTSGYDALGEPRRPAPAMPPTPAEVERYRQRLENRLLERYNNLPEYSGKVSKVTVVLSRPLETSMDGTMIRAEFDQLVFDPWGKRIAELEREYFAVTFASGGVQQMRSDPSIRIGLDMEKTYSERAPLTADPFSSGPLGTGSAPVSDAFGAVPATKMPSWWRPQGE